MHLTENIDFTVGSTFHMTFSDLIDNVIESSSKEHITNQPGNKGTDKFLMNSFSISYKFFRDKKPEKIKKFKGDSINYLAFDDSDEDNDGIIDFIDKCPWTPEGVEVDENGCPLDKDHDFVPNYKDDELETREGAPVSADGVELTDSMIYKDYQRFMDSTGVFAEMETKLITTEIKRKTYKVQVGAFTEVIDASVIDRFLSIPDVEIKTFGDSLTVIVIGDYNNLPDAIRRKILLTSEGFDAVLVVEEEKDGTLTSVGDEANNMSVDDNADNIADHVSNSERLIFRVQLGAFSQEQPKSAFGGLEKITEIKTDDKLYKYLYSGSFNTVVEAANKKLDLAIDYGLNDAFIVAYKDGKRISLKDAGMNTSVIETDIKNEKITYNKSAIKFKIQIGIYKNQVPTEVLSKFMELDNVEQTSIDNGLTRYTSGSFNTFKEAEQYKNEIVANGIGGALVIALHNEELIPVNKAKELVGE